MSAVAPITVPQDAQEPTPKVELIDARQLGLCGEAQLRERARAHGPASGAPFSCRSYSFPFALVAWHEQPLGVDIERVVSCDRAFADSIRTPQERAWGSPTEDRDRFFTSLWSSKEALSKALGDALDYDPRRLQGPGAWPRGRSGPWRASALEIDPEHVAWLCWRTTTPEY